MTDCSPAMSRTADANTIAGGMPGAAAAVTGSPAMAATASAAAADRIAIAREWGRGGGWLAQAESGKAGHSTPDERSTDGWPRLSCRLPRTRAPCVEERS